MVSQAFPNAEVVVPRAEQLPPAAAASSDETAQQACDFKSRLGEVISSHDTLAAHLKQAVQALERAEQNCGAAAITAAQHLAQQDAEFAAAKAKAATLRESLERQLADAESALGEAVRRSADDRSAAIQLAAQRKAEFEAVLSEEVAKYDTLARDLLATRNEVARTDTRLQEVETRHAVAMTTAAAQRHEQEARHEARIAEAAAAREAVSRQLQEVTAALDGARQAHLADATAAADRLAQQEATLREGTAARQMLEGQLADAHTALQTAEQRATAEGLAARQRAAERDAEFVARLDQEAATRETLEQALTVARNKVAEAETAIRNAESRHAAHLTTVTARFADQQVQYEIRLAEAAAARDLVDQRQRELEVSFERSREERAADAAAAAERVARLEAQRLEALANLQMLEGQVADANAALQVAEQRAATERLTAERQAAERHADLEAEIARETAGRHAVEQDLATSHRKLAESESARRSAEQRHASAMTSAEAQFVERHTELETRLSHAASAQAAHEQALLDAEQRAATERLTAERQAAERQAELEAEIARETAGRHAVEQDLATLHQKLAESESALRSAEQRHASALTSAEAQFVERHTELERRLSRAASAQAAHEQARLEAEQRHAAEMKTAASQFAERQREVDTLSAQVAAVKEASDLQLREAEATLERIHDERAAEAITVAEQLTQLESALAKATANGETLERRLAEVTNSLHSAEDLVASERVASAERATERQKEFDAKLSIELGTRNTIEQALAATRQDLAQTESALRYALEQHTKEMTAASNELSEQRRQYAMRLALASAAHARFEQRLADADQLHASVVEAATRLSEQQRDYETSLAEVTKAREIVSQQLHDTETTLARIRQESDANAIASAERLSQRESELAAASAARQVLEGRLADTETALEHAEARALAERTAAIQHSEQRRAEFDAQLAREVEARNVAERDLAETRIAAEQTQQALLGQSAALTTQMRELEADLTQELARERADYEGTLADLQMQLRTLNVEREALRESLDQVRADAVQTLNHVESEHASELVRINALVAERDGQMKDQAARHAASQETDRQALAKLENELRATVTAHRQQVEQLQSGLKAVTQDFEQTRGHRDALQVEADRVPQLTNQVEASRAERRRQFEGSPIGILRCNEAGELRDANRALITALGYRTVDELRALGSAASIFESPDDFRWLMETGETPSDSIDWIWKKKDGGRLIMRLRVLRLSPDVVDIVAEDLTTLRAVEERLRQAQRMEAVGRLASEVAVTCDNLLRNVSLDGQQWLATVGSNTAERHRAELIFGEVTRAASLLRQLSVYGAKEASAPAGVEVNEVLRDLAPVLKRVAGDGIELVLPKKIVALNVDVDPERVERVLVNIAAHGRARMPSGGRLIVELARVVVDRDFVTKYPNVRQGAHALISVTEVRTAAPAGWLIGIREPVEASPIGATSEPPGVDLGALQVLIGDCGGHLWMNAERRGDMELKIHLPLRSADTPKGAGVLRSALRSSVSSWFQS